MASPPRSCYLFRRLGNAPQTVATEADLPLSRPSPTLFGTPCAKDRHLQPHTTVPAMPFPPMPAKTPPPPPPHTHFLVTLAGRNRTFLTNSGREVEIFVGYLKVAPQELPPQGGARMLVFQPLAWVLTRCWPVLAPQVYGQLPVCYWKTFAVQLELEYCPFRFVLGGY